MIVTLEAKQWTIVEEKLDVMIKTLKEIRDQQRKK